MDKQLTHIWAKTGETVATAWHPLILHMLDVAASADAILAREPETTRKRMAAILGMEWEDARTWLLLVIACHDLGKACPGFQCKWENMTGMDSGRSPNTEINHAFVSQIFVRLCGNGIRIYSTLFEGILTVADPYVSEWRSKPASAMARSWVLGSFR